MDVRSQTLIWSLIISLDEVLAGRGAVWRGVAWRGVAWLRTSLCPALPSLPSLARSPAACLCLCPTCDRPFLSVAGMCLGGVKGWLGPALTGGSNARAAR